VPDVTSADEVRLHEREMVPVSSLRPHPRNYRAHPEDQVAHLMQSLREHGLYRNLIVARDGTVLAGHGVLEAARRLGLPEMPVVRLDLSPNDPKALKLLAADNELGRFAEVDDRALTDLLREISRVDVDGLLGTGYDETQLAALVMITRPASEIADQNAAAAWVGLPGFEGFDRDAQFVISIACATEEDRARVAELLGLKGIRKTQRVWSAPFPPQDRYDSANVIFDA
jgi:hypothetical protein